jgi:hypothetical protein
MAAAAAVAVPMRLRRLSKREEFLRELFPSSLIGSSMIVGD